MSDVTSSPLVAETSRRPRRVSRASIMFLGVIVIPFALGAILNSYGPLTEESAIRMAFATVAGQTVAILSAIATVVVTVIRRADVGQVILIAAIALFVTLGALSVMAGASDALLARLHLVAETNLLNE